MQCGTSKAYVGGGTSSRRTDLYLRGISPELKTRSPSFDSFLESAPSGPARKNGGAPISNYTVPTWMWLIATVLPT